MQRGKGKEFIQYTLNSGKGKFNNSTDTLAWALISDVVDGIDFQMLDATLDKFNVLPSAGAYLEGTDLTNVTWTADGDICTYNMDDLILTDHPDNPFAMGLAIYNKTSPDKDVFCIIELSVNNGTTPANTQAGIKYEVSNLGLMTREIVQ